MGKLRPRKIKEPGKRCVAWERFRPWTPKQAGIVSPSYPRILKVFSLFFVFYCCSNWKSKLLCKDNLTLTPFYKMNKSSAVRIALVGSRMDPLNFTVSSPHQHRRNGFYNHFGATCFCPLNWHLSGFLIANLSAHALLSCPVNVPECHL